MYSPETRRTRTSRWRRFTITTQKIHKNHRLLSGQLEGHSDGGCWESVGSSCLNNRKVKAAFHLASIMSSSSSTPDLVCPHPSTLGRGPDHLRKKPIGFSYLLFGWPTRGDLVLPMVELRGPSGLLDATDGPGP